MFIVGAEKRVHDRDFFRNIFLSHGWFISSSVVVVVVAFAVVVVAVPFAVVANLKEKSNICQS